MRWRRRMLRRQRKADSRRPSWYFAPTALQSYLLAEYGRAKPHALTFADVKRASELWASTAERWPFTDRLP